MPDQWLPFQLRLLTLVLGQHSFSMPVSWHGWTAIYQDSVSTKCPDLSANQARHKVTNCWYAHRVKLPPDELVDYKRHLQHSRVAVYFLLIESEHTLLRPCISLIWNPHLEIATGMCLVNSALERELQAASIPDEENELKMQRWHLNGRSIIWRVAGSCMSRPCLRIMWRSRFDLVENVTGHWGHRNGFWPAVNICI